ncbi:hypothetical protein C0993_003106 [Termitomyces sp. T159_Od127]|nr:hypothetical protein C0993_003106 [Termitomyces sp. T159_Od127]
MLAALLAVGVNIKRSILFYQDHNPSHTELAWLLNCITPVGKLRRMTTWKARLAASRNASDESEVDESLLNTGLFTYPVLQAADILLYRSTHVPVGDDQTQHLELCRDLAETFNRTFAPSSPAFPLPVRMSTPSGRILSLRDPTSKMSKSSPDIASRILLTDTDAQIKSKIRSAVTDSIAGITYDPVERPGTSNLLTILAACTDENVHSVAERYEGKRHSELKADVADAVVEKLRGPRDEFQMARRQSSFLDNIAYSGAIKAKERSDVTMQAVRKMVGLPDIGKCN